MTLKAIVFDIGGVLLRTEDRSHREALEKDYQLPPYGGDSLVFESSPAHNATIGQTNPDTIWAHVAQTLELSSEALEKFKQKFWQGDKMDTTLLNFLVDLKLDYTTALLSNAWSNMRRILERDFQIREGETVDHILISAELGVAKPDPEIYRILSEKIHCKYSEILFIDDFIENIESARKLGIETIHYQPGMALIKKIKSRLQIE